MPVYHFDFYRLEDRNAGLALGLDDYFFGDGVSVVEWADRFRDLIPTSANWIVFENQKPAASSKDEDSCPGKLDDARQHRPARSGNGTARLSIRQ